jgi:hypothetical protein
MTGRAEVMRLKQRLDATFVRLGNSQLDIEVQSDLARYLCVLVSGFLEQSMYELVVEHARRVGAPSLQRFVDKRTRNFTNPKCQKLLTLIGDFNPEWRLSLEGFLAAELKDAVDGVVNLRNTIAHGRSVGVTYATIEDYYRRVQKVVEFVADFCDPA